MPNETFPKTQKDVSNLKQTATDAVNDISGAASEHASRAKDQLKDLAGHIREDAGDHLDQVKGSLNDVVDSARNYVSERPFTCIATAFAFGLFFGLCRSGSSKE